MRLFTLLLLFVAPLRADEARILEVRLAGARKIAAVTAAELRTMRSRVKSGVRPESELASTMRADLDARLSVAMIEMQIAAKKAGRKTSDLAPVVEIQRKIVELEADRLEIAKTKYKNGTLGPLAVLEREEAHLTAFVSLRVAEITREMKDPEKSPLRIAELTRDTAVARKKISDRRLELVTARHRSGQVDSRSVYEAKIRQIKAETHVALAEIRVELLAKAEKPKER